MTNNNIAQLEAQISTLQAQLAHFEEAAQRSEDVQQQLDVHVDRMKRFFKQSQSAFTAQDIDQLHQIIIEGIIDIFQLEQAALFVISADRKSLRCLASHGTKQLATLAIPPQWLENLQQMDLSAYSSLAESPVAEDSPWFQLELGYAVYMPLFSNSRKIEGILLGGFSKQALPLPPAKPQHLVLPFMLYCQQMNGLYNNFSALLEANEAIKTRAQMMANLSHEIRTPLNAIIGMVQLSDRSSDIATLREQLKQIGISSRHLLGLINDVLDISKIEDGKIIIQKESFHLSALVDNVLNNIRAGALAKQQQVKLSYHDIQHFSYIGDSMRLSQVLINLLSNAVKFTPRQGTIELAVALLQKQEKWLLEFSVTDNGIGMSPDFFSRLFLPFEQADSGVSRKYGGTGLGLAISQRLVNMMGGVIDVQSELGKGSRFSFQLWLQPDAEVEIPAEPEPPTASTELDFSGKRILIVDDIEINREIVAAFLQNTGVSIDFAGNGQEALEKFATAEVGHYDLILMDVQMPVMDGYSATRCLRALNREDAGSTQILAMTASVFKEDIQLAIDSGMNGHIAKPIEADLMLAAIQKALQR